MTRLDPPHLIRRREREAIELCIKYGILKVVIVGKRRQLKEKANV